MLNSRFKGDFLGDMTIAAGGTSGNTFFAGSIPTGIIFTLDAAPDTRDAGPARGVLPTGAGAYLVNQFLGTLR